MKNGYSLIEILVAVAIFTIVIAAPTGFFTLSLKAQLKSLASQKLLDNTSYTLEYISRSLRMAKKDTIGNCVSPLDSTNYRNYEKTASRTLAGIEYLGPGIKFLNYKTPPECQEFFLDETEEHETKGQLMESKNGAAPVVLTSKDLEIISFKIGPDDSWDQDDTDQPRVTLFLDIKGGKGQMAEIRPEIKIQTTISQRNLDVQY
jgi:prepilin-type N-terminal cleavage/methylation domain-containing protein